VGAHLGTALQVPLADGRELEVVLYGPEDGVPVVVHHGTPGAAGVFQPLVERGAERGLRHVAYSRPGYGGSGRDAGRSVASCVGDVAAIVDALGCERFYSVGGSGGGPHSIACAALLGERVIAAAAIASPAPADAEGLDWTAGMGKENVSEFAAARAGDAELLEFLEAQAQSMDGASGEEIVAVLGDLVSDVDRQALSGALGDHMAQEVAHALSPGTWGWFDDDRAILGDWGFDLADIRAPLSLWHGAKDRFVPIAHGEWLAAHVDAEAHLRRDHGHLSLTVSSYGEILDELLVRDALRR
jgi:pimeloyl-ACP methyl ester carboxylesterase